jgi:hypothetical protein
MAAVAQKSDEETVMKKVANAKTNKEKAKINKVQCPCSITSLTPKRGLVLFGKGLPIFTMKTVIEKDGKEIIKDILFTSCSKTCTDGNLYCHVHQKAFEKDPSKIVKFNDLKKDETARLIEDANDPLLNSRKGKKATPKKNRREIHKRIVDNDEAYNKYMTQVDNIETQILQELNQAEFSTNVSSKPKAKKETPKKINKKKAEEVIEEPTDSDEEIDEEVEEEVDINESDDEVNEESDEIEFEDDPWETTDGREYLKVKNQMIIYSPEEKSEAFAELINVENDDAPFIDPEDGKYYIAAQTMEIKSKNYVVCKITDTVYDCDSMKKLGKAKKNKSGVITGIKKG